MNIDFHAEALEELRQATVYYETQLPGLGLDLYVEVSAALDRIREHPHIGSLIKSRFRRVVLNRFPFSIVYRLSGSSSAVILAVAHHSRRPGYWRARSVG